MKPTSIAFVTLALLGLSGGAAALDTTSAPPVPANRIVGLWDIQSQVGPCNQPPGTAFRNLNVFHAGGTMSATNSYPLAGVPSPWGLSVRGPLFGTWRYDPLTRRYQVVGRFYWFVNGVFHGWHHVTREVELSPDGDSLQTTIRAQRFFVNGDPPVDVCGLENGHRVE